AEAAEQLASPCYLAASHTYGGDDRQRIARLDAIAHAAGTPLVGTADALYHTPARRPLQDVLTCIREHTTLETAGYLLNANAERHLRAPEDMARLFSGYEHALARTTEIVEASRFSLEDLRYNYPREPVPSGRTPQQHLEDLSWAGARERFSADKYPDGIPEKVRATLRRELDLIEELGFALYFLTVHDIVQWARTRDILCQGRGSAANSVVCYCLHITSVDPEEIDLLFERFISRERKEAPDIDVDFEHERREEVMQYIYERYGRDRAGIAATVISYRPRSAIREVGKVMGLSEDVTGALAGTVWGIWGDGFSETRVREAGLDPDDLLLRRTLLLVRDLIGFPRHLSQHVGGFVLTQDPLREVVPIGKAAMADRTFVEWDKDDLDALGILKIDILALGMLTCIRKSLELMARHDGEQRDLASFFPATDPATYEMIRRADTLGVFQIESRAQMSMLPRLKPRVFYDLVIEIAIVRPGPIQGGMVHPYLRRRAGLEPCEIPSPDPAHGDPDELRAVLGKTLGVPLFQEQAMSLAMKAAQFTSAELNGLRRAMATFRRAGTIHTFEELMITRMTERGYDHAFARQCFDQIKGFAEYGFPESHSASFALLAYVSSWLKCHRPEVFACGLLNAQPMGFYAPAQIVRDAREHGVEVRPVDINMSEWDNTLEPGSPNVARPARPGLPVMGDAPLEARRDAAAAHNAPDLHGARTPRDAPAPRNPPAPHDGPTPRTPHALRLGMRQITGLREDHAHRLVAARTRRFESMSDVFLRTSLPVSALEKLADADAFRSIGLDRRAALWEVRGLARSAPLPLFAAAEADDQGADTAVALPEMPLGEHVIADYQTVRLSLKAHPMGLLRRHFTELGCATAACATALPDGTRVSFAGVVLVRQRPGTAKGVMFMTLEDETGVANAVIWPDTFEAHRRIAMSCRLVVIHGRIQAHESVVHIVVERLEDHSAALGQLSERTVDFPLAHADEVVRPVPEGATRRHPRDVTIIPKARQFH
ncbi:MAG: error-prone DNA polymerase, partial [Pseudomonadota bacterium]